MQNNVGAKNELLEAINKVVQEKVLTNFGSFITVCVSSENFCIQWDFFLLANLFRANNEFYFL